MDFFKKNKKKGDNDLFNNFFNDDFSKVFNKMFRDIQSQLQSIDTDFQKVENQPGVKKRTYGFTMKISPDGQVKIDEFGNVNPDKGTKKGRQPLVDVMNKEKEISIIAELPGVSKKDIKLKLNKEKKKLTIDAADKYYKEVKLPVKVKKIEKQTYKNGVLDITLKK